jgi:ubiquinone/menaquinone biosynthesis C-methylase UbiE
MSLKNLFQDKSKVLAKSIKQALPPDTLKYVTYGYSVARSFNYTAQASFLPWLDLMATGKKREAPKNFIEHLKEALPKIEKLLWQDSQNIAQGYYPLEVLKPESVPKHIGRLPKLFVEAFKLSRRRKNKVTAEFKNDTESIHQETPDYYCRNFHYQNSGYLSTDSSELYDHQVEMLFSGTANPMRRIIIPEIKRRLNSEDGAGLNFLEIGCGNGTLTEFMALAFPKAKITCVDLSPYYLKSAQNKLKNFSRINFVETNAESLPFKDSSFDVVFSCFLFHELPQKARENVLQETQRVLKKGGYVGAVDSLQIGDDTSLDWALKQFPIDFHEPFYKNYAQNKLEDLFAKFKFTESSVEIGFLSKSIVAKK